jgi:hypothetical protein
MTKLKDQKSPTVRETDAYERSSAIVVSLHPRYLTIHLKGARESLDVPYGVILKLGRKMAYKRKAS